MFMSIQAAPVQCNPILSNSSQLNSIQFHSTQFNATQHNVYYFLQILPLCIYYLVIVPNLLFCLPTTFMTTAPYIWIELCTPSVLRTLPTNFTRVASWHVDRTVHACERKKEEERERNMNARRTKKEWQRAGDTE